MNTPQLAELERRAYRTVVDDGLLDILLALLLLALGVEFATNLEFMPVIVCLLAFPLWRFLRSRLVEPRIGYVELHSSRRSSIRSKRKVISITLVTLATGLVLADAFFDVKTSALRSMRPLLSAAFFGIPITTIGLLFDIKRFIAYGLSVLGAGLATYLLKLPLGLDMLTTGSVVLVSGFAVLTRFLRQNPKPSLDESLDV